MKIGARIIKTALAVFLCTLIGTFLQNTSGFFMAIAAVITMQGTIGNSFLKGKERIFGTFTGACIGYIFALMAPGNPLLIGIGIILTIYTCNLLNWKGSSSIACIVFLAIMLNNAENPLSYSIQRLIDTSIGIIITLFINYLIVPLNPMSTVSKECHTLFEELSRYIHKVLYENNRVDLDVLHKQILNVQKKININELDAIIHQENTEKIERLKEITQNLLSLYEHLKFVEKLKHKDFSYDQINSPENGCNPTKLPKHILEFHTQWVLQEWNKTKELWEKADRL